MTLKDNNDGTFSIVAPCSFEKPTKEEALKLADDLEELHEQDLIDGVAHLSMPQASAMIRRLVEELDKKATRIKFANNSVESGWIYLKTPTQTKPLSDEEIKQIFVEESGFDVDTCPIAIMDFARAIEERHGIK